jgi:hypothetical protein
MKIKSLKRKSTIVLVLLLCASCSVNIPRSTITYVDPVTKRWEDWPKITDETEKYKVTVEPLGNMNNTLVFDINVQNKNMDSLYIDPTVWKMYGASQYKEEWIFADTLASLTPLQIAEAYDDLAKKMQTAKSNSEAAMIFFGIILLVGIIALAASTDSDDESYDDDDGIFIGSSSGFSSYKGNLPTEKQQIRQLRSQASFFRGTTHEPLVLRRGESAGFEMYFLRKTNFKVLRLQWGFNDEVFEWEFFHSIQGN